MQGSRALAPAGADALRIGFAGFGKLSKVSVEGGAVVPLGDFGSIYGASWGEDGNIVLGVVGKGLLRIHGGGGVPETVAAPSSGETALNFPHILPGGKAILFSAYTNTSPDAASIEVITLADRHRKTVSRAGTSPGIW